MLSIGAADASGEEPAVWQGRPGHQAYGEGSQWDALVRKDKPTTNFGNYSTVDSLLEPERRGYLMFDVRGLAGPVQKATLSLRFIDGVGVPVVLRRVSSTSWSEMTLNWNNQPSLGDVLATFTPGADGRVSVDVTPAVTGNGRVSFRVLEHRRLREGMEQRGRRVKAPKLTVTTARRRPRLPSTRLCPRSPAPHRRARP